MKFKMILIVFISINTFGQKIPITSTSDEAISLYNRGWALENRLQLDEAERLYKKAVELDSAFAIAHLRLAMVKDNFGTRRKKLNDAVKYIDMVSEGERLWILAKENVYSGKGDLSKEYEYSKKLVELYPEDERANFLFGYANVHHGQDNPKEAIKHYEKALRLNRNFLMAYNYLAYAYMDDKDFGNAKRICRKYIELLPNQVNPLDSYAEVFMKEGNYEESIAQYENVLKLDSSYPWAIMGISANLNFLGRHEEAREVLEKIVYNRLSDYEYRHTWRAKVVSYIDEGALVKAIATLQKQKIASTSGENKREPNFHIYYSQRRILRLHFENEDYESGLEAYEIWNQIVQKVTKRESTLTMAKNAKVFYGAYSDFLKGDLDMAIKQLNKYDKLEHSNSNHSKILRGRILLAQQKSEQALELLMTTEVNNPYNQYWIYKCLMELNRTTEANSWKEKILGLNDRNNIDLALARNLLNNN